MSAGLLALSWAHPWAWLLAALPLPLWGLQRRSRRADAPSRYADASMRRWAVREAGGAGGCAMSRRLLEALLWMLLAAALAGPRQLLTLDARGEARLEHRVDLMVLLQLPAADAPDALPLERQRMALRDLQSRLRGERLGLMVYDAASGLLLPCTSDSALFDVYLDHAQPALLRGRPGPGLTGALALARRELLREPGPSRALLLLPGASAGHAPDAPEGTALLRQAAALRDAHIPVYLAWSGRGEPPPRLRRLVSRTGGARARLEQPGAWSLLYRHGIATLASNPPREASRRAWRELYGIPLLGAMLVLLALQSPRLRRRRHVPRVLPLLALGLGLGWGATHAPAAHAADSSQRRQAWTAWTAWRDADYAACARLYRAIPGFDARLGEGDCEYRAGHFDRAVDAFRGAMLRAGDDRDRAVALYNLGNAAFHVPGRLREALDAYRASLVLMPRDPAARRNLRLAQARWAQQHPEYEITGLRKRGMPQAVARFGDTSNPNPSQLRRHRKQQASIYQNQRLQRGGKLEGAAEQAAPASPVARLSAADIAAAHLGMRLLHDHRSMLLDGLIRHDTGVATDLARAP